MNLSRSNLKQVSINLPDNEISLANSKILGSIEDKDGNIGSVSSRRNQVPARSPVCFPFLMNMNYCDEGNEKFSSSRSILEVLREIDADVVALQDVKAEEEKCMKPLSDLAAALGMKYVFAESWAPEYGNAILSKWPIKKWKVQKIADDDDFRNVIKATIDVPWAGEINLHSTQLDHLDENWRMKQVNAIIRSNDPPHILAGGLNSLYRADYSSQRWTDIVQYYEKLGKPRPMTEVMNYMKSKDYDDAKDYAGECEPIVIIAKGQ
ncbi:endonuclease/exonuclease/phosphatase family protein, partial [Trifolium pratense]